MRASESAKKARKLLLYSSISCSLAHSCFLFAFEIYDVVALLLLLLMLLLFVMLFLMLRITFCCFAIVQLTVV